mmetsp:Transcript_1649/g.4815  ORF Transcript_1649/g.4815 Transcript_1649/m.4815 type:complete len:205 (-) Transcript_1649:25-639(-)
MKGATPLYSISCAAAVPSPLAMGTTTVKSGPSAPRLRAISTEPATTKLRAMLSSLSMGMRSYAFTNASYNSFASARASFASAWASSPSPSPSSSSSEAMPYRSASASSVRSKWVTRVRRLSSLATHSSSMVRTDSVGYLPLAVSPLVMVAVAPCCTATYTSLASARVGRGALVIEANSCVATMAGLPYSRARSTIRSCSMGTIW